MEPTPLTPDDVKAMDNPALLARIEATEKNVEELEHAAA